jgi:hypothetical protein
MSNIKTYQNGNYMVSIDLANGTKTRENDLSFFKADFPECCDYKITNCCPFGNCQFCHENSTPTGKHGDILGEQGLKVLESFHEYTELAIGGGDPLSHPDLIPFLRKCKELNLIPNMTVHQFAFMKNQELIEQLVNEKLIYGIGVSLVDPLQPQFLKTISKYPNLVLHVINGIVTMDTLRALKNRNLKILILGYKTVRRGEEYVKEDWAKELVANKQKAIYDNLGRMIDEKWFSVISFDNLAIKQLEPQRLMSEEDWNIMYMGEDYGNMSSASMYIDGVEMQYARNSCDVNNRYDVGDKTVTEMYQFLRDLNEEKNNETDS